MTRRGLATRAIRFVLGTLLCAGLVLPLTAQNASACDVSYEYKPSIDLKHFGHNRTCSTSTSLGGVTIVGVLALGALAAAGAQAFKRGAAAAGGPSGAPGSPSPTLIAYLQATNLNLQARASSPPAAPPGYPAQPPYPGPPPQAYPPGLGVQQPPPAYGRPQQPPYAVPPQPGPPPRSAPPGTPDDAGPHPTS
ncbi:hypothetical protein [Actinomadura napierensis]|uniref:Uncharacterized protein n=1 Tax=Actinomadura napierensis TaxID=267854 RepID=A0ABP5LG61_9ACTN